jgi:iron complex outermembrane receptor protein
MTLSLRLFVIAALVWSGQVFADEAMPEKKEELFEMPIEKLMEIEVVSTATLTEAKPRLVPAAMTTITEEQIQASGARSLFELLDIYVPNLQWWRNQWEADNMGLRGVLSDRDDKYLLLVNGRVMNERTRYGALSERDLVFMRDIHHIDIVRGPGSALYGPGAVAMVINIITHNAETFQGTEVTGRLGAVEEFYSGEVKHGHKFDDGDGGYFVYAGASKYPGASEYDAPHIYGFDFPSGGTDPWDGNQKKGDPFTYMSVNDGQTARDMTPMKLYAEMAKGNWNFWGRYTSGGKMISWPTGALARSPYGWGEWASPPYADGFYAYKQATGFVGYNREFNEKTKLETSFSYDMFDFQRRDNAWWQEAYSENKYIGKMVVKHDINKKHKIAVGAELLHGEYGYPSHGWPHMPAFDGAFPSSDMPRWGTNMYSVFGEHQWTISEHFTTFLGIRYDKHTYTDYLSSPRASVIYTPTKKDTFKFMWARSVRANYEDQLENEDDNESHPESLESFEVRYERRHNENLDLAVSLFDYYQLELIGWSTAAQGQAVVGMMKDWGIELEATYHTERTRLAISHSYTQLTDFKATEANIQFSAQPYSFGNDLQRWANHVTKIIAQRKLDDRWTLDGSMRVYWGFPGLKDYAEYYAADHGYELDWERSYQASIYMNLGLQYKPNKNTTFRVDGYNLLGMFDCDLNKRNYGGEGAADYRCAAPAVGVTATWLIP